MEKTARDVLKAIKEIIPKEGVDLKSQVSDALKQLDQLSSQDQQYVADVLEKDLIGEFSGVTKEDVMSMENAVKEARPGSAEEKSWIRMSEEAQGIMMLFQEIEAIKGNDAEDYTRNIVSAYGDLPTSQKDDFLSIVKVMYQANNPQCDFFTDAKAMVKKSTRDFFAPLTALYKKVAGRKAKEEPKPDAKAPKPPKPKGPKR
jgi:hypothetical protein